MPQIEILVTMTLTPLLPHDSSQLCPGTPSPPLRRFLHTPGSAAFPCPLPLGATCTLPSALLGPDIASFLASPSEMPTRSCSFSALLASMILGHSLRWRSCLFLLCHLWLHCSLSLHCLNLLWGVLSPPFLLGLHSFLRLRDFSQSLDVLLSLASV